MIKYAVVDYSAVREILHCSHSSMPVELVYTSSGVWDGAPHITDIFVMCDLNAFCAYLMCLHCADHKNNFF